MGSGIDEVDLGLLDAIHLNPRVGFDELGSVLGVSGVTAARRWRRLVQGGRAWVSSAIGPALPVVGAVLEAECVPGAAQSVADRWAAVPQVFSVHITTGRYDVYAQLVAADHAMLTRLIVDTLPRVDGIWAVQSSMMFRLFSGTHWRLGAITASQARAVAAEATEPSPLRLDDLDRQLYLALQHDGRLTFRELGARLQCSETLARRRLQTLIRSGAVRFRADFARAEAGWPVNVVLTIAVPDQVAVAEFGRKLVELPETRVVAAIVGEAAKLFVTLQVHELGGLDDVTARLRQTVPAVSVLSRRVVLRPVKSFGRLLDIDGHARAMVPVDPWASEQP